MLELTLDEAIKHCKENVQKETQNGNLQCAIEHNQLAIWLSQLEESKTKATAYDSGGSNPPQKDSGCVFVAQLMIENGYGLDAPSDWQRAVGLWRKRLDATSA